MLKGKTVLLGVTGSIAAYKIANLASMLKKLNCNVHVIMTKNASYFINPITFETLTENKCHLDTFDRNFKFDVEHISLAKQADLVIIAPASANIIGKMANGIADDMLTTTILACTCKKIISPAMNTNMFRNPIVRDNLEKLKEYGMEVISPVSGRLACGDVGEGKMVSEQVLLEHILKEIAYEKDMLGKKVLVTAGPTREKIDSVRYITNHSTGKMGYAIARHCMHRGAEVTLVTGKTSIEPPSFINVIKVDSAKEMFDAVIDNFAEQDIIIKAAAVADYTPMEQREGKIKKADGDLSIQLKRTDDILKYLGEHKKEGQFLCGFSMESENLIKNSSKKLENKNADMIVANNLNVEGAGFATDTNVVTFITKEKVTELPIMTKEEVAKNIINFIMARN